MTGAAMGCFERRVVPLLRRLPLKGGAILGKRGGARGFTLIEVLIALAITAAVATLAFSSLSAVLDSAESLRRQGGRIAEVNRAWALLSRDLNQFAPRPVRDAFGAAEPALTGGGDGSGLSLTRAGWRNPDGRLRSTLQRVRYHWEDGALWRESYPVLDRTAATEPQRVRLLEGVESFELAFLARQTPLPNANTAINTDGWLRHWAVDGAAGGGTPGPANIPPEEPPEAVEIRLTLRDWGELRWLYELPAAR